MLLVLEVGNTNTSVGVYDASRLLVSWRLTSRRDQTADEYGVFIQTLLATRGVRAQDIGGVAISNVVPPVQQTLEWVSETYFGIEPFTVRPGVNTPLPLNVDHPTEVGADRVCNGVAAIALYGPPLIVVDFGTATNFDCINARGEFVGGAIAPGMATAAEALISRAARLFRVELLAPRHGHRPQHRHQHPVRRRVRLCRARRRAGRAHPGRAGGRREGDRHRRPGRAAPPGRALASRSSIRTSGSRACA